MAAVSLDARDPRALERADIGGSERADNHVEPPVWIVLIQTHLKILRRRLIPIQYRAPFDVEDAVRGAPCDRGEDAAGRPWEVRTTVQSCIGAHVLPQREDGVVIRHSREIVGRRWQTRCDVAAGFVYIDKIQTTIVANVHPGVGGAVQLEVKRQRNKRIAPVAVIADVCIPRHDPICPLSYNVLATLDRVASSEGLVRIANLLCDRSTGDALRQASPEFATRLFNRAHKHGSVEWEKVPNRSPEVIEVVKIVTVTIAGPIFVRRQEHPVEKVRWRPARADVHAAIIDHDVQR